jgi:hypothetical protein
MTPPIHVCRECKAGYHEDCQTPECACGCPAWLSRGISELEVWIPGAPPSPNATEKTTRGRMVSVKRQREKAFMCTVAERNRLGVGPIRGRVTISFVVLRHVPLDDDNLTASCKHVRDGVWQALLPLGDGGGTPYRWQPPTQELVPRKQDGVRVRIALSKAEQ